MTAPEPKRRRSPCSRLEDQIRDLRERLDAIIQLADAGDRDGWHKMRSDAIRAIARVEDQ